MQLLLINPNSSENITERLAASARPLLGPADHLTALTASEGPRAVTQSDQLPAAAEQVLAMARRHGPEHDAVLIAISLDCGLAETRAALSPRPVIGMTEAACLMALLHGPRFGLLTLGPQMAPLYEAHVASLGLASRLAGLAAPELPQAYGAPPGAPDPAVLEALAAAAQGLLAAGADSLVLAGAVLCGYAPALTARVGRPVLDGIACGVLLARARLTLDLN
ncbi:aspartate/glutamate racemase family protein [Ramlibacter sp. 2FC]|uniref:aspartate/glutamate racemase family protein n=1 Tax=Ramlibacter sp. 2FC TaxID=2502188 RepID=UPI0010F5AFB9|nr:aspartate/glutamate racemase family protein [Ramlibacter sp. 2FC]